MSGDLGPDEDGPPPDDLTYQAWTILANVSGGDWSQQTPEWVDAVTRWRDRWHASLDETASPARAVPHE